MSAKRAPIVVERTYRATPQDIWNLWATAEGFTSWWGPQGFRVEVHILEPRVGGRLHYDMIASAPEAIAAMTAIGRPLSHPAKATFSKVTPYTQLEITNMIDFLPDVPPYEATISVEIIPMGTSTRMVVTLSPMHDDATSAMQKEGFESQLTKLDRRTFTA